MTNAVTCEVESSMADGDMPAGGAFEVLPEALVTIDRAPPDPTNDGTKAKPAAKPAQRAPGAKRPKGAVQELSNGIAEEAKDTAAKATAAKGKAKPATKGTLTGKVNFAAAVPQVSVISALPPTELAESHDDETEVSAEFAPEVSVIGAMPPAADLADESTAPTPQQPKRGRGRPKGSKSRPKPLSVPPPESELLLDGVGDTPQKCGPGHAQGSAEQLEANAIAAIAGGVFGGAGRVVAAAYAAKPPEAPVHFAQAAPLPTTTNTAMPKAVLPIALAAPLQSATSNTTTALQLLSATTVQAEEDARGALAKAAAIASAVARSSAAGPLVPRSDGDKSEAQASRAASEQAGPSSSLGKCMMENCTSARRAGGAPYCKRHGGGRRCTFGDCNRPAASGTPALCGQHGGGKRCQYDGCNKFARNEKLQYCTTHGGGNRCQFEGCKRGARCGDAKFCTLHGGGHRCQAFGCKRAAVSIDKPYCCKHGGGKHCQAEGCDKGAVNQSEYCLHCTRHGLLVGDKFYSPYAVPPEHADAIVAGVWDSAAEAASGSCDADECTAVDRVEK